MDNYMETSYRWSVVLDGHDDQDAEQFVGRAAYVVPGGMGALVIGDPYGESMGVTIVAPCAIFAPGTWTRCLRGEQVGDG